jgi:hypothetical protein
MPKAAIHLTLLGSSGSGPQVREAHDAVGIGSIPGNGIELADIPAQFLITSSKQPTFIGGAPPGWAYKHVGTQSTAANNHKRTILTLLFISNF